MHPLIQTLILSLAVQCVFFAFAAWRKTDVVTDLSYGLTFIILAIYAFIFHSPHHLAHGLLVGMVTIWGVRLAGYLFMRILIIKSDKRFDGIRERFWEFAKFWVLQAISVWLILLPVQVTLIWGTGDGIAWAMSLGLLLWLLGLGIETVADLQKFFFKLNPKHAGQWTDVGLWSKARHPNYFGEMLTWWGVFMYAATLIAGWGWLSIIGPIYITSLLLFVTGVPPLEQSYQKRYGKNEAYRAYKARTNLLVPV